MRVVSSAVFVVAAALAACAPEATTAPPQTAAAPAPVAEAAAPARTITLPVSINAVMVGLVDHASEPLWLDAYTPPKTDDGWREAEYEAYQMAISGKLIQLAGTGPNDHDWVQDPDWIRMADELSSAGMDAVNAAQLRKVDQLNAAGDRLVAACEDCHKKFKPGLTSMGIYKSPNYPPKN